MKVVLILSLALVLLASVSFAGPARVILPAYAPEETDYGKRETVVEDVEEEPKIESNLYQAVEVDDGDLPKVVPLVSAFGLKKAELQRLYQLWLPNVPAGEDSSFQAFLDWKKEEEESEDAEKTDEKELEKTERSAGEEQPEINQMEVAEDEQQLAEVQRSVDEEQPEINELEIAAKFGLTEAELEELYQKWVGKSPDGEDTSFETFVDWMEENDEPEDDGAVRVGTRSWNSFIRWSSKVSNWFSRKNKKEYVADEQELVEDLRSADEEQPEINQQQVASDFGLTEAELEELYQKWVEESPDGEDTSFETFVDWMKEIYESKDDDAVRVGSQSWRDFIKWGSKENYFEKINRPKKEYVADEQQLAEVQRSVDEEQAEINQEEVATITEDKRDLIAWLKKIEKAFKKKKQRELEEDQQQGLINGQESLADRDLQASNKPGPKSATNEDAELLQYNDYGIEDDSLDVIARANEDAELSNENSIEDESQDVIATPYDGKDLFEAYRKWLRTVGEGQDKTFQAFFKFFKNRKSRSFENELSDESQLTDMERREDEKEEEQKQDSVEETETKTETKEDTKEDTSGGYSCEKNSPCNIENISNEEFYFATTSPDKFIQCDAWGGCHTLTCEDGLIWDDEIKTCGIRT